MTLSLKIRLHLYFQKIKNIIIVPFDSLPVVFGALALGKLEVVGSMHERKRRMADLANAFVALPGGWGTLDELAEILTWNQLGLVKAPVAILNTNNYFDSLLKQMEAMVTEGFLSANNLSNLLVAETPEALLAQIHAHT